MMKQITEWIGIVILFFGIPVGTFSAQTTNPPPTALVLSGGGGRGAYEIGAWKALTDLGFKIGGVYGASVGSINGTGIIMNDYKKVRDLWFKLSYLSVMNIPPKAVTLFKGDYNKLSFVDYIDIMRDFRSSDGIDVTPLKHLLQGIISEKEVRASNIDYGLVSFSLTNFEPKMMYIDQIPKGQLLDYILASANFPLFKRQKIKGELFIDGGVYSNVPVEMAVSRGFKNIIVVDIAFQTPVDLVNLVKNDFDKSISITFIRPERQFGSFLTFERKVSQKYLKEGYLDSMKVFGRLHGDKFYIYGKEDIIKEMFDNLSGDKKETALSILGADGFKKIKPSELYEKEVVPKFKLALLDTSSRNASDTNMKLLENLAESMHMELLTVYTESEFLQNILGRIKNDRSDADIFTLITSLRYGKIINFLKYLDANSFPKPSLKGYVTFMIKYKGLLK